jgi:hypothetical protein
MSTDLALWVTAFATVALVVAATAAGWIASRALGIERRRELRAQAERIGAWTATLAPKIFGLCLLNDSSLPVTEVEIFVARNQGPPTRQRYRVLPPGYFFAPEETDRVQPRPAGPYGRLSPVDRDGPALFPTTLDEDSRNVAYFTFLDAFGQRWKRNLRAKPGEPSLTLVGNAEKTLKRGGRPHS